MFFGTQEIKSINNNLVTLKNGETVTVSEKEKQLFTEESITGSELQMKWSTNVAKEIMDVLFSNNVRLTDIGTVMNLVNDTISGKNDEAVVSVFGKEKLDTLSHIFGAKEDVASISVRNIRMQDIFNT